MHCVSVCVCTRVCVCVCIFSLCPLGMQKEVALLVEVLNNAKGPYSHYARNLKKLLDGLGVGLVTIMTVARRNDSDCTYIFTLWLYHL